MSADPLSPRGLALVEPFVLDQLVDRPNLGCAMLVAACREQGLPVTFIGGQPDILAFLARLDPATPIGGDTPVALFRELYDAAIGQRGPRPHFSGTAVARLQVVYLLIMRALTAELEAGADCSVPLVEHVVGRIALTGCAAVGFSLQGGFEPLAREIRRRLRDDLGFTVIAGGPLVSRLVPAAREAALRREHIDYLVTGPAEGSLPRLLRRLEAQERPSDVRNVFFLEDGAVAGVEETVHQDLDALPAPDFSDVDFAGLAAPETILPLETARGCTWNRCAFCDHHTGPTERYSAWSIARVVEILAHLREACDCHEFALHDLELPARRAVQLSEAITEAGLDDIRLTALARFTAGYAKPAVWETMRRAGFTMIEWGLESGCQRTLDAMRKGSRLSQASTVLRMAAEAGVANECFVLFGFPGETREEAEETFTFLRDHRAFISLLAIAALDVLPGAALGRDPAHWGLRETDHGMWEAEEGVGPQGAKALVTRLASQQEFDPGRFSGEPVRSVAKINASRILYGLLRSHRFLTPEAVAALPDERRLTDVFPLVLGSVHDGAAGAEWRPVTSAETPVVNLRAPCPPRILGDEELAAFELADGTRSLAGVCGDGAGTAVRRRFVEAAVGEGLALAFGRRWEP